MRLSTCSVLKMADAIQLSKPKKNVLLTGVPGKISISVIAAMIKRRWHHTTEKKETFMMDCHLDSPKKKKTLYLLFNLYFYFLYAWVLICWVLFLCMSFLCNRTDEKYAVRPRLKLTGDPSLTSYTANTLPTEPPDSIHIIHPVPACTNPSHSHYTTSPFLWISLI